MYGVPFEVIQRRCPRCLKKYQTMIYAGFLQHTLCERCRNKQAEEDVKRDKRLKKLREGTEPTEYEYKKEWKL